MKSRHGICKKDINSLKSFLTEKEYEKLKYEYRTCGVKRTLVVREGATDMLREIEKIRKRNMDTYYQTYFRTGKERHRILAQK